MDALKRTVLFRGKRVDNGEWIYGGLIVANGQINPGKAYILNGVSDFSYGDNGNRCRIGCFVEVGPSTVCQYTGLTDKNGVKIFEGDIARGKYGSTVYQNEVIFAGDGFALRHSCDQYGYCASLEEHDGLEVIGNIFDNPELLGENNT